MFKAPVTRIQMTTLNIYNFCVEKPKTSDREITGRPGSVLPQTAYIYTYTHIDIYIYVYRFTYIQVHIHVCLCLYNHMYIVCVYIYIYTHMYMYMYIWISLGSRKVETATALNQEP